MNLQWYIDQNYGNPYEIKPDTSQKLIINAAITGMIPQKTDTPYVPITSNEIIKDAIHCFNAGASIVHLHARDENEDPTYQTKAYADIVPEIREQCPGIIINITTSGRKYNTLECRSEVLELTGSAKPDMASLTMGSLNFPKQASINAPEMITGLATKMLEKRIKPELEIFETGMINYAIYLHRKGILKAPLYFNILLGSLGTMPARIIDLEHLLKTTPENSVWGATGIGKFQYPMTLVAILKGGHVRVGLEDNIWFDDDRTKLAPNADFIRRLVDFAESIGRKIASPTETRQILNLPQ